MGGGAAVGVEAHRCVTLCCLSGAGRFVAEEWLGDAANGHLPSEPVPQLE